VAPAIYSSVGIAIYLFASLDTAPHGPLNKPLLKNASRSVGGAKKTLLVGIFGPLSFCLCQVVSFIHVGRDQIMTWPCIAEQRSYAPSAIILSHSRSLATFDWWNVALKASTCDTTDTANAA